MEFTTGDNYREAIEALREELNQVAGDDLVEIKVTGYSKTLTMSMMR